MILKAYSLGKSIFKIGDVVLFYGKNDGLKKEEILKIISLNKMQMSLIMMKNKS